MATQRPPLTTRVTRRSHNIAFNVLQSFPFLKLPAELRNKIYRSLLIFDCALLPNFEASKWYWHRSGGPQYVDTQILRVSRQICNEAREVLVKGNEFVYMEKYDFRKSRKYQQRAIYNIATIQDAPKIRATFGFGNRNNDMYAACFKLLAKNPNLISLHITFDCIARVDVRACHEALSLLEKVKVRDKVVLHFVPQFGYEDLQSTEPNLAKRQKEVIETLKVLEKKMLEN